MMKRAQAQEQGQQTKTTRTTIPLHPSPQEEYRQDQMMTTSRISLRFAVQRLTQRLTSGS
jgi:hypothetical protein